MSIEAMKQALEASKDECVQFALEKTQEILEAAIAEAEKQEPVAWFTKTPIQENTNRFLYEQVSKQYNGTPDTIPLYTNPQPKREPLTDEQMKYAKRYRFAFIESPEWTYAVCKWDGKDWLPINTSKDEEELDSAIEAAHGIKGEA